MLCYIKVTWSSNLKDYEVLLQHRQRLTPQDPLEEKQFQTKGWNNPEGCMALNVYLY